MTPFLDLLFELYLLVHFIFAFQDLQNSEFYLTAKLTKSVKWAEIYLLMGPNID